MSVFSDPELLLAIANKIEDRDMTANNDFLDMVALPHEDFVSRQGGAQVTHWHWRHNGEEMFNHGVNLFVAVPSLFNLLSELNIRLTNTQYTKKIANKNSIRVTLTYTHKRLQKEFTGTGNSNINLVGYFNSVDGLHKLLYQSQNAAAMRALASLTLNINKHQKGLEHVGAITSAGP